MNRVGEAGRGESVWLGWFFHAALTAFAPIAAARHDTARAKTWTAHAETLAAALDRDGWDGEWYRRGYYDDGKLPLGSAKSQECRIDPIAQSWAAMSGAGDPARAVRAWRPSIATWSIVAPAGAALHPAVRQDHGRSPAISKAIRPVSARMAASYTHAAAWAIMGFAALGQGDKAAELFALVNPINHTSTAGVLRYKVEPYVVAADVYSVAPHVGGAAGPGTPALPAGSTAPASRRSWVSGSKADH